MSNSVSSNQVLGQTKINTSQSNDRRNSILNELQIMNVLCSFKYLHCENNTFLSK